MSRPCLQRWHKLESAYTARFSRFSMRIQVNGPPVPMPMDPPSRKKKHGPPWPMDPLLNEESRPGALTRGRGGSVHMSYFLCGQVDNERIVDIWLS